MTQPGHAREESSNGVGVSLIPSVINSLASYRITQDTKVANLKRTLNKCRSLQRAKQTSVHFLVPFLL